MFSTRDVKHILNVLLQQDRPHLTLSDEKGLLLLEGAEKHLDLILEHEQAITCQDLRTRLKVDNIDPLLARIKDNARFSTPLCRRPDLAPWSQKAIAIHVRSKTRRRFVRLSDLQDFWGLPGDVVLQIYQAYSSSLGEIEQIDGFVGSCSLVRRLEKDLASFCTIAASRHEAVNISDAFRSLPLPVLSWLAGRVYAQTDALGSYQVNVVNDKVVLRPHQTISQNARYASMTSVVDACLEQLPAGFCVIDEARADDQEIVSMIIQRANDRDMLAEELHRATAASEWSSSDARVVVTQAMIRSTLRSVSDALPVVSQAVWHQQQDKDRELSRTVRMQILAHVPRGNDGIMYIINSTKLDSLEPEWQGYMDGLAQTASKALDALLIDTVLCPFELYTAPLATITDATFHANQSASVTAHLLNTVFPNLSSSLLTLPLPPPRASAAELERFTQTARAKTPSVALPDLTAAIKRLRRKLRIPATEPNSESLRRARDVQLRSVPRQVEETKRASDVLQFALWALLACMGPRTNGGGEYRDCDGGGSSESGVLELWVGSGKDAGRLVKLLGRRAGLVKEGQDRDEWLRIAARMVEFREAVVKGSQGVEEVNEVKKLVGTVVNRTVNES